MTHKTPPARYRACALAQRAGCLALALAMNEHAMSADVPNVEAMRSELPRAMRNSPSAQRKSKPLVYLSDDAHRRFVAKDSGSAPTTVWMVVNCADSGSGSLRDAVAHAGEVDTIDMTSLTCATITLTTGAIVIGQDDLIVNGPGMSALTIDAANFDRAFFHTGHGNLYLNALSVTRGYAYAAAGALGGGCIYSAGDLALDHVAVSSCTAYDFDQHVAMQGGGIYARYGLSMTDSSVTDCSVVAANAGSAFGGGVFARNDISMLRSNISGNRASAYASPGIAVGGGAYALHGFSMEASTLSGNVAKAGTGGLSQGGGISARTEVRILDSTVDTNAAIEAGACLCGSQSSSHTRIANSTLSGNVAVTGFGGAVTAYHLQLANSTVAFNFGGTSKTGGIYAASGAYIVSSIVANNALDSGAFTDLYIGTGATLTGAANLIRSANQTLAGTLTVDPMLGPLQNNGGTVRTHGLLAGSPAIDVGSNLYDLASDERGAGFARVIGMNADIGAFESGIDRIFADGFD